MSRFTESDPDPEDIDMTLPSGNQFGIDGKYDLTVDEYGEPAVENLAHISKSRIKKAMKCMRDFANTYLAEQRVDSNFYMERGTAVHDAFERFHQNLEAFVVANQEAPDNFTDLMGASENWFQFLEFIGPFFEWELDRLDAAKEHTDSMEAALDVWTPHSVERSIKIEDPPVGELPWLGPYDALLDARSVPVVDATDGYVVVDYKTGSVPKEKYRHEGIHVDLEFYGWILEEEGIDAVAGVGLYPGEQGTVVREYPNEDTREDMREIIEHFHEADITREEFPTYPNPLCDYCDFQEQCPTTW